MERKLVAFNGAQRVPFCFMHIHITVFITSLLIPQICFIFMTKVEGDRISCVVIHILNRFSLKSAGHCKGLFPGILRQERNIRE
jgi:hypothetical protein